MGTHDERLSAENRTKTPESIVRMLQEAFEDAFGYASCSEVYFAPGRINLIGEHIDYNGGMVMPCAIDMGTYAVFKLRSDQRVCMRSMNFEAEAAQCFELGTVAYDSRMGWANYPMGIFATLMADGYTIPVGMDILFYGNIMGGGLSSSASIEVLMATLLNEQFRLGLDKVTLALLCQRSENIFNGVNCGIMDQFAVTLGKASAAILLDCETLEYAYVPMKLGAYRLIIIDTHKKRALAESAYNERRNQCDAALSLIQAAIPNRSIQALCDISEAELDSISEGRLDDLLYRRAHHAVSENQRTHAAREALSQGDLEDFGRLMYASHDSLRDAYEVSCFELDTVVSLSREQSGVLGARMTGAGFGGCAIALVHEDQSAAYIEQVGAAYTERTGLMASFYVAAVAEGARRL